MTTAVPLTRVRIVLDNDVDEAAYLPLVARHHWMDHHRDPRNGDQPMQWVYCTEDRANLIHYVDDHNLKTKYILVVGPKASEIEQIIRDGVVNWPTQMILDRAREENSSPKDRREVLYHLAVDTIERGFDQQVFDIYVKALADSDPIVRKAAVRGAMYLGWPQLMERVSAVATEADQEDEDEDDEDEEDESEEDDDEVRGLPPVYVTHLIERIPPSTFGFVKHLEAAEALVSRDLLEELEQAEPLDECRRSGWRHMWLATLQEVGRLLEEEGKDEVLPVEYWHHLMWAAYGLDYPQMIPYLAGKAERRPHRVWYDVLAALVVLDRKLPEPLRVKYADAVASIKAYVDWMETLDTSHPALFHDAAPDALYERFLEEELLEVDPDEERFKRLNRDFQAMFNKVFTLVTDPALPNELQDVAWSVLCVNYFIVNARGLISFAEVWWRY